MEIQGFAAGPFKTNCYLIVNEGHVVIIDPGMYSEERISKIVADQGLVVDKVLLTHGHIDHTRNAAAVGRKFGVPVFIHEDDAFMIMNPDVGVAPHTAMLFDAANMPPVQDLRFYGDGDVIDVVGSEYTVRHAPGHSPGSVMLEGDEVCFTGDVVFQGSVGRTDILHSDPEAMRHTLAGPVLALPDALHLLPGHGPVTTMRAERARNPYLQGLVV